MQKENRGRDSGFYTPKPPGQFPLRLYNTRHHEPVPSNKTRRNGLACARC